MIRIIKFDFTDESLRLQAFAIRTSVFVEEQHVDQKLEYDDFEKTAKHYLVLMNDKPAATGRWRETTKGIKLERFAVLPEYRNHGLGTELLEEIIKEIAPLNKTIYLHSQLRAVPLYERQGFVKSGEPFTEAEIEHYYMELLVL